MLKLVKRPNSQVEGSIRRLCKRTLVGKWEFDSMAFLWAWPWLISWSSYTSGVLKGTAHFLPNCRGFSKLIPLSIFTQCQPVSFVQINQPSWNLIWFPCLTFCKNSHIGNIKEMREVLGQHPMLTCQKQAYVLPMCWRICPENEFCCRIRNSGLG